MSFAERMVRQQAAIFRALGEDAYWNGAADPIRVRRSESEDVRGFGDGAEVVTTRFILVPKGAVAAPEEGDRCVCPAVDATYEVMGEPRLNHKKGVWTCEVRLITTP